MTCLFAASLDKRAVGAMSSPLWAECSVTGAILADYNIDIKINTKFLIMKHGSKSFVEKNFDTIDLLWQGCMLQFLISNGSPTHRFPPFLSGTRMARVLPCMPPPQLLVHKSQFVHVPHLQSTK